MQPVTPRLVDCPGCAAQVEWALANRFRPFCSARCKEIDVGAWASDQYRVPGSQLTDSSKMTDLLD